MGIHDAYRGADQMGFEPMEIPLTVALPAHERRGVRTEEPSMTRRCELTGKLPMSGPLRSHAENKTKRTFRPNLCSVALISDALKRKVRLRVSAHALKSVEHRGGLDAYLLKAREEELSDRCRRLRREVRKAKETAAVA